MQQFCLADLLSNRTRGWIVTLLAVAAGAIVSPVTSYANNGNSGQLAGGPQGKEARKNMRLVGTNDLQGRSIYQPEVHKYPDGRYILFAGEHGGSAYNPLTGVVETNGTSIVDVTDPANPVYLHHIPASGGFAQMVQVCDGSVLPHGTPGKVYLLRNNGNLEHQVWDVTDPTNPVLVSTPVTNLNGTHKNWWQCDTGIAYLIADLRPDGWPATSRGLKIFDLSDPMNPVFIRDFSLSGAEPGGSGDARADGNFHEVSVSGDGSRVYAAYGTSSNGVLQILDNDKLLHDPNLTLYPSIATNPSPENLLYPQIGRVDMPNFQGGHSFWEIGELKVKEFQDDKFGKIRDIAVATSEATSNACQSWAHMAYFLDVTDPVHPFPVANFQVPESEMDFCQRGGRFGTHSLNWSRTEPFYKKIVVFSYFNAGARAVDVRDPYHPKEVGYYIPATTANTTERCATIDGVQQCKVAIQTNNVQVDDRGLIYLVDRANTGLHIVELTGPARHIIYPPGNSEGHGQ